MSKERQATKSFRGALERAKHIAEVADCSTIGTEHLLLALVQETPSLGSHILARLGVTVENVQAEIDANALENCKTCGQELPR